MRRALLLLLPVALLLAGTAHSVSLHPSVSVSLLSSRTGISSESTRWDGFETTLVLSQLAVGYEREVLGLTDNGTIVAFDRRDSTWTVQESDLGTSNPNVTATSFIAMSCDSDLYRLDAQGRIYVSTPGSWTGPWTRVGTHEGFVSIAVGKRGDVWGIDAAGTVKYFLVTTNDFYTTSRKLKQVAVSCDGSVWGVSLDNNLEQYVEGEWTVRGNRVAQVEARQAVYLRGQSGRLWQYRVAPAGSTERPRSHWYNMNKIVRTFSVGPDETLWAIDENGSPIRHRGENMEAQMNEDARRELNMKQGGEWVQIPGAFGINEVSTGILGELYGLTKEGKIIRYDSNNPQNWEQIPGPPNVVRISSGCDGLSLWAVTADSSTHRYVGNGKWLRFSEKLDSISIGENEDYVYGIRQQNKRLVQFNRKDNLWILIESSMGPVDLQTISAGCDHSLWGVDLDGALREMDPRRTPGVWNFKGDGARSVAVGRKVYILDNKDYMYEYVAPAVGQKEGKQSWKFMHKQLRKIVTNLAGEIYGIDLNDQLVRFRPIQFPANTGSWEKLPLSPVKELAIANMREIYGLDPSGVVLRYGSNRQWDPIVGTLFKQISAGCDGAVWGLRDNGELFRMNAPEQGFQPVQYFGKPEDGPVAIAAAAKDVLWGINSEGLPMRWRPSTQTWKVDRFLPSDPDPFVSISVKCNGEPWAVGHSGITYRRIKDQRFPNSLVPPAAEWLRYRLDSVEVDAGYRTYVIDTNHFVWKYEAEKAGTSPFDQWVRLGPMVSMASAADGTAWGIGRDGSVYQIREGIPPSVPTPIPPTPTPSIAPSMIPQPDEQGLSPFIAGTTQNANALAPVDDPDDVTSIIARAEQEKKFRDLADAKSIYSPFETETETFGNAEFNQIDPELEVKLRKKIFKNPNEVFNKNPPF